MAWYKIFFEKIQLHPCVSSDGQDLRKYDKPMHVRPYSSAEFALGYKTGMLLNSQIWKS